MGWKRKTEKDYYDVAMRRGFKWLGNVLPKNIYTKTWWECKKGHKWEARYNDVCKKSGCPVCARHVKKNKEDYYSLAKNNKFKWVGKNLPKNVNTKTTWECKKGHRWEAPYSNIYSGSGCPYCTGQAKKTEENYNNLAGSRKFKWVDKKIPPNVMIKTWWECAKKHKWKATYDDLRSGNGCPFCSGKAKKTEKDYYSLAKKYNFKWISTQLPINVLTRTVWECEKGHEWWARYSDIQKGHGCPHCVNLINGVPVSRPQIKLSNLLYGSLNYTEGRYRIDVAIMRRSQKIAVEYDAQYWHQGREKQDAKRDKFLISHGWKILHIKSGNLLPTRKKLNIAIKHLLETNDVMYNIHLKDWKH